LYTGEKPGQKLGPNGRREWDLLDRVTKGTLSLGDLFDAWSKDDLDGLRARLADDDLALRIPDWDAWLADRVGAVSKTRYVVHVGR
jgi:hypothetical protein